jgi:hypothetical protein
MPAPSFSNRGVTAIDSATVVRRILFTCGLIRLLLSAIAKATKANSPTCALRIPVCCDSENVRPLARERAVMIPALQPSTASSRAPIFGREVRMRRGSIEKPTVMKKNPSRMPRKGAMSDSTW